ASDAQLRVYVIQPKDPSKPDPWLKLVQQISLGGVVAMPPMIDGRRVMTATTSGIVRVYEAGGADAKNPLRQIAEYAVEGADNVVRYPLFQDGQLWIADNRLTKYDIQAARGRLESKWVEDAQNVFLQPPMAVGQAVVAVHRKQGAPGAAVSARAMQGSELYWSTQLGAPLAGAPQVLDDGKTLVVTSGGAVFRLDGGASASAIVGDPVIAPDVFRLPPPVKHVVRLPNGLIAMSSGKGSQQIGLFDPKSPTPLVTWLKLRDKLACAPVAMGRGLIVATLGGQVLLIDSKPDAMTGDPVDLAEPFQPKLEVGQQVEWITPTVVNDNEAVISDGKAKVYRLGIQSQPKPHLAVLADQTVTKPIVSPFAAMNGTVYATDAGKALVGFNLAKKLSRDLELPLAAQYACGPVRIGETLLLATDDNQLLAIDSKGKQLWLRPLVHGPLAGVPLLVGGAYLVASRDGTILRLDAASGKELGKTDVGCPLATAPVARGERVLVGGYDGTLYEVRQP
ncbi:MAG: PQQ-binding-like beta-propeller repeat protein, partial [Thermoguttaceae bacterium]